MWFTYTENPISWHPINIYEVKKLVELNKKGITVKPLDELLEKEDLKVDLIEENNLHRFEKKSKSTNKRKSRNKNQQKTNTKNTTEKQKTKSKTNNTNSNQQKKRTPKKPK